MLSRGKFKVPRELEDKGKTIAGNPKELVDQLKELGHQNLNIDDGITIQGFLEEDLKDEMIVFHSLASSA